MKTIYLMLAALFFGGLVGFITAILLSQFSAEDDEENDICIDNEQCYYKKMIQLEAENEKLKMENLKLTQKIKLKDLIISEGGITVDEEN